ncbi:hypothetical protein JCM5296_005051 [Sporobolomyces johnsonii]
MPAKPRSAKASSRTSSTAVDDDSDIEIVQTGATSPATSVEEEAKDGTYNPEEEEKNKAKPIGTELAEVQPTETQPVKQSDTLKAAFKAMVGKAEIYMQRIEEHKRKARTKAGQPEDSDDEVEIIEQSTTGSSKKRKRVSQAKTKQRKKMASSSMLPERILQSKLVSGGTLKDYQLDGLNWLVERYLFALFGAILADEMGTGKTLQTISFISFLHEHIRPSKLPMTDKPTLVVLPKAVLGNWEAEFKKFAPSIPVLVYAGSPQERGELRQKHLGLPGFKRAAPHTRRKPYPVILVTYQIAMNDVSFLEKLQYDLLVCDEAHKAKNLKGKTLASLQRYQADFRLLLTGTPLQNNLTELYALLSFILPKIFTDQATFESMFNFSSLTNSDGSKLSEQDEVTLLVAQLQNILKPFMLRRCKKDVVKDLPLKKEYVLTAPLTARQKELTDAAVKGELRHVFNFENSSKAKQKETVDVAALENSGRGKRRHVNRNYAEKRDADDDDQFEAELIDLTIEEDQRKEKEQITKLTAQPPVNLKQKHVKLSSVMTNLRQIANHPLLKLDDRETNPNSDPNDIVHLSGKMMLLDRLLPELFRRGHKVIIFSQFTQMLDLLDEYIIDLKGWNRYRIDGRQENQANQDEINEFNTAPVSKSSTNVFLLSTRAGGVGINLIGADTVILFDSDWNPQNDLQAMDRAHRIGQTKPVLVFRLATANTVEQTILASATRKRKLERVVLGNDTLAGDAGDILNKAKGKKATKNDTVRQLAEQLASAEGEKVVLAGAGSEILTDAQLNALLDRSDKAMKSTASSSPTKGARSTNAAFEVVETIEEEEVASKNVLADLMSDDEGAATTDED